MDQVFPESKSDTNLLQEKVDATLSQKNVSTEPAVETDRDINWKKFREAREIERKQAEEVAKRAVEKEAEVLALKAAMEAIVNKPSNAMQNSNTYNGFEEEETEDQRIEKKVNQLLAVREQEFKKIRAQEEQANLPQKLRTLYSDFEQVCSNGNLDYLEYHHPELARSLGSKQQSLEKWTDIYKAIKRYIPNVDTRKEQARADANFKKPQSLSSAGVTQGGNAMPASRLDDAKKAENWARMQRVMKGLS